MISRHAKILRLSGAGFKALRLQLQNHQYSAKKQAGFIIEEDSPNRLSGRFFHIKTQRIKNTDPETLVEEVIEQPVMLTCNFSVNFTSGIIYCNERRSDLNHLEDVFNGLEGVRCEFEDFATDVTELYRTLRDNYGKIDLRNLRIKDYLGREGLLATASFKLMEPGSEDEIMRKYVDDIQAFSATLMTDDGRKTLNVSTKGSVRFSDDFPEDMIETVLNYLPQFHEEGAAEVETVMI